MKRLLLCLCSIVSLLCLCDAARANTFYVATSGNDSNAGSLSHPWLTLQHAVDNVNPGDTILVESGTYAGCRIGHSGQSGAPCTLKADSGASVLINAPGPNNKHGSNIEVELFDDTVRYWVIDGFESANSPRYGIDVRTTDFITVQNCYAHNSALTGIFLAFSDHPFIQNNECAFNGEHGIYDSNSGDYPTISENKSHHNHAAGIHMNGDRTQTPGDGIISFAVVEKNIIYENGVGGGSGINCDGVSDSIFRNNLIYNNHASGISLYAIDGAEGSSRNKVYNNTIVMPSGARWCLNIPASTQGQPDPVGNQVRNNILYTPDTGLRGSIVTYAGAVSGFTSDYNVVVNRFSIDEAGSILSLAAWQALGYDGHSILSTPDALFVDAVSNNYHLKPGSPAIAAGVALVDVIDDLDGLPRPVNGPAIGCYEGPSAIYSVGLSFNKNNLDSDSKSDIGFYRAGLWGFLKSSAAYSTGSAQFFSWGGAGLQPIVADFDGDGKADIGYLVPPSGGQSATYSILLSSRGYSFASGQPLFVPAGYPSLGDTPVVGDVDGDGKADPGIWRATQGVWIIPQSSSNYTSYVFSQWGQVGDVPVLADFDGDGKADLGFYRNGLWGILQSSHGYSTASPLFFSWGGAGLQPIVGDFDGDGKGDIGYMVPPSGGQSAAYAILLSSRNYSFAPGQVLFVPAGFPVLGDTPIVGDFDGDGKSDPGIWRESQGVWIIPLSSANYTSYIFSQWGQSGDIAFPNSTGRH